MPKTLAYYVEDDDDDDYGGVANMFNSLSKYQVLSKPSHPTIMDNDLRTFHPITL